MPDMDGYAVLQFLKKHKVRIPVTIVLTNLGQEGIREKCMKLGAEDFYIKSDTGISNLWEKIQKYLPQKEEKTF